MMRQRERRAAGASELARLPNLGFNRESPRLSASDSADVLEDQEAMPGVCPVPLRRPSRHCDHIIGVTNLC